MKANKSLAIDGILLLNKPEGMTSNTALQKAKRLLGAQKAGHTGSLDPLATGMLPLCFGEATKVCQFLLDADKCYQTTGLLGVKTNTADATGEVTARVDGFTISEAQLLDVLEQHTGHIKQIPSMFSALKHNGTPLYRLAREGINIERKAREILISNLQLTAFDGVHFSLTVTCSKGTYIRNLVEDIGDVLGVGAHVTRLHRVYTSGLDNMPMYSLDALEAMSVSERMNCLIPMDRAVNHLEQVTLLDDEVVTIRQGRTVLNKIDVEVADCVRLYDKNAQFIGLGERNTQGDIKAKRLLSF
ncbi:tRNA pseudouridine(55) synthase TruB [Legionella cherrii]|uniref:tRNA pseudouridine synthase B n=1 Tax=Legionella cherrii TaxID=28084 RepID=A0A0W0SCK4_9GAMM|nr:tRNA pseudouridine(55) synthase TruB [Legionella cherrii]KTC81219.1 tRNA pseudouridine synthase B [Legionella cherrii]VEB33334.1 tRNA pseudouridine synthase B [Legionella cherrii]